MRETIILMIPVRKKGNIVLGSTRLRKVVMWPQLMIVVIAGVVLVIMSTVFLVGTLNRLPITPARVYTVNDVQAGLRHDPVTWIGQTVLVSGVVGEVAWEQGRRRALEAVGPGSNAPFDRPRSMSPRVVVHMFLQPDASGANWPYRPLQLQAPQVQSPDPLPPLLRGIPWLRSLVPAPQQVRGGVSVTYRIRLLPGPWHGSAYISRVCDEGVVLSPIRWR
jgi:hypothetical protein